MDSHLGFDFLDNPVSTGVSIHEYHHKIANLILLG